MKSKNNDIGKLIKLYLAFKEYFTTKRTGGKSIHGYIDQEIYNTEKQYKGDDSLSDVNQVEICRYPFLLLSPLEKLNNT